MNPPKNRGYFGSGSPANREPLQNRGGYLSCRRGSDFFATSRAFPGLPSWMFNWERDLWPIRHGFRVTAFRRLRIGVGRGIILAKGPYSKPKGKHPGGQRLKGGEVGGGNAPCPLPHGRNSDWRFVADAHQEVFSL